MLDKSAIQEIAAAQAIISANNDSKIKDVNVAALPDNFNVHDLEAYLPQRRRCRGTMKTSNVTAFARYFEMHKEPGASVFIDADKMNATAVLNLGTPVGPGHADNLAIYNPKETAAYTAMKEFANGNPRTQAQVAEFFEDWIDLLDFYNGTGESHTEIKAARAISSVRKISIEALRKIEAEEGQLSASRSAFESVTANNQESIPTHISFTCNPFNDLGERAFSIRLSIITADKPMLTLRIAKMEQHREEMAEEVAQLVRKELNGDNASVLLGNYQPKQ